MRKIFDTTAFVQTVTDLKLSGVMPIELVRFYNSTMGYKGFMGHNWDFSLNRRLVLKEWHKNGTGSLYYYRADNCKVLIKFKNYSPLDRDLSKIKGQGFSADGQHYMVMSEKNADQLVVQDKHGNKEIFKMVNVPSLGSSPNLSGTEGSLASFMNFLIETRDAYGNRLVYSRDYKYRIIKVEDPDRGRFMTFEYNPLGLLVAATDSAGRTVFYRYAWNSLEVGKGSVLAEPVLIQVIRSPDIQHPLGTSTRYEYDDNGLLAKVIDGNGKIAVANIYKDFSRVADLGRRNIGEVELQQSGTIKVQLAVNQDTTGNRTVFTDSGGKTNYTSDKLGNILKESQFDQANNLVYEKTCNYQKWAENVFRKIQEKDSAGCENYWEYDQQGNVTNMVQIFSSGTLVTRYAYEMGGLNQLKYVENSAKERTFYDYGFRWFNPSIKPGKVETISSDGKKTVEKITYNADGQVKARVADNGVVTEYRYDAQSGYKTEEIRKQTDGSTSSKRWSYDAAGNVVSEILDDGRTICYSYDSTGNITEIINSNGMKECRYYDAEGNLLSPVIK